MFESPDTQGEHHPAYIVVDPLTAADSAHLEQIRGYTIADAYARFLRATNRPALLCLDFDMFGPLAEGAAIHRDVTVQEWVQSHCEKMRTQCELLGYSFDWERTRISSNPEHYRCTQQLFLTMLEQDVIYKRGAQWLMRVGGYLEPTERGLDELSGWDETAIELQRAAIGRVDGFELEAHTLDGASLTVFTPHSEAIAESAFVAISPHHPAAERWISPSQLSERLPTPDPPAEQYEQQQEVAFLQTDALSTIPGVAGMLPVVISPLVDERFGATAVLGIPSRDPADQAIAERLPAPSGTTWTASTSHTQPRPAVRYRARDVVISRARSWGTPIPLVHCPACGTVPVPLDHLPVCLPNDLTIASPAEHPLAEDATFYECLCPRCETGARRETDTLDGRMDRMWMWMRSYAAPEARSSGPSGALIGGTGWLPAEQMVAGTGASTSVFERRLLGNIMQSFGRSYSPECGEPFSRALMHDGVRLGESAPGNRSLESPEDLEKLIKLEGSDTIRLRMLYAASPHRSFEWDDRALLHCKDFLQRLYDYAEPRLGEWARSADQASSDDTTMNAASRKLAKIDTSDKLRRRLARWCAAAEGSVTSQLELLDLQRATHNTMRLLTRIQDFESRVLKRRGEVDTLDREAIVAALLLLVRLLTPITPYIAEELWLCAGNTQLASSTSWPVLAATNPA